MTHFNEEASPIARLIVPDGKRTVGWVYAWETSELSVLWIDEPAKAAFIEPALCAESLAKAKLITPARVIAFLGTLREPNLKRGS